MFSLSDLKQTKVYQEALEEGREEGELAAKLASIPRLLALGLNFEQIAQALELEIEQVRQATQGEQEKFKLLQIDTIAGGYLLPVAIK